MTQFTISIPDSKANLFLEFMKSISFIKRIEEVNAPTIPENHKKIIRERVAKNKSNPHAYTNWEEIESEIALD